MSELRAGLLLMIEQGDLVKRVIEAATVYREHYNQVPNCCHVNERQWPDAPEHVGVVRLVKRHDVLRDHLWIGITQ